MGRGGGLVLLDQGATWTGVGVVALSALLLALGILLFARWRRVAEREAAQIRAAGERTEKLLERPPSPRDRRAVTAAAGSVCCPAPDPGRSLTCGALNRH